MAKLIASLTRRRALAAGLAAGLAGLGLPAWGQAAGDNTLKIVVPYPPGGTTDLLGRILAEKMHDGARRIAITENRPGAGGNIGAAGVAKAKPDGNTLLFTR